MGEFRFDPDMSYLMPAHFGAAPLRSWTYAEVTTVGISYRTDREVLSRYIPECFIVTDLVSVNVPVEYRHGTDREAAGRFMIRSRTRW